MLGSFLKLLREIRQRRADLKTAPATVGGLDVAKLLAKAQKARDRLWKNPPPCGSVIRYVQQSVYEDTHGEFLFSAADVEDALEGILQENPHLRHGDEGALLAWLGGRDESVTEPTDIPSTWSRFQYVASDLVRGGKATIRCKRCETEIGADQFVTNDDNMQRGYNFDRVVCPQGHNLLVVDSVHLTFK